MSAPPAETPLSCPACDAPMTTERFEGHYGRTVDLDLCHGCGLIWFDRQESLALTPGAVLKLFVAIDEHRDQRHPLGALAPRCPRCRQPLISTTDQQRATRFSYWRCPAEHGRLTNSHGQIAAELGCHAIRTNMYPDKQPSTPAEIDAFIGFCSESFANLCEFAKPLNVSVIIENHGGISSNPDVVVRLMQKVNLPNFGILPDFGNFPKEIDRYDAVRKLMAYAKGASFKCYDFGPNGKETTIDMDRMMKVVLDAGFHGWVGIEYEGSRLTEFEGIQAAKRTSDIIPLCHPLRITGVDLELRVAPEAVHIQATVRAYDRSGVEMEALAAVSAAALTIYDMCKAIDRGMSFSDICLLSKSGGKSGTYNREG